MPLLRVISFNTMHSPKTLYAVIAITSALFSTWTNACAQDCDGVLRDGVFNKVQTNSSSYSAMTMAWRYAQMTASEVRSAMSASATLPIEGVPFTGSFSDEEFKSWSQSIRQSLDFSSFAANESSVLQLSASNALLQSWENCMAAHNGLSFRLKPQGDDVIFFTVKYRPDNVQVTTATIETSITIVGGTFTSAEERNRLTRGMKIGPNGVVAQIKRNSRSSYVSLSLGTTHGTVTAYVPGIVDLPVLITPKRAVSFAVRGNVGATCDPTTAPVGAQHQLRGDRNPIAKAGEWTPPLIVDADNGDGGVALQFAILDPDGRLPSGAVLQVGLFDEDGYANGQCNCTGWQNIPVSRTEALQNAQWTSGFRINTDSRDGGCRLKFQVMSAAIRFSVSAKAEDPSGALQVGDPNQLGRVEKELTAGQTADIRMNTDGSNGGAVMRFKIDLTAP